MMNKAVSVTALVRYIKGKLENDAGIQGVLVEGEISNFSAYRSGHWYFSMKDSGAQIRCVMFSSSNKRVSFMPKDGDKIIVRGDINVYEGRGELQMLVTAMKPAGIGKLFLEFEALKKRLEEEGLFDESHKKAIPAFPMRIALVTGKNTAARSDVLSTLAKRWPAASVTEYPVLVQGDQSAEQIRKALLSADNEGFDVILLVRGGGSIEDLWSFNDEQLARTIYALSTPVVTGVGHETDFTIADFVADLRAPTPTGAAVRSTPDISEIEERISQYRHRMVRSVGRKIDDAENQLNMIRKKTVFSKPERLYSQQEMHLRSISETFLRHMNQNVSSVRHELYDYQNRMIRSCQASVRSESMRCEKNRISLMHILDQKKNDMRKQVQSAAGLLDAYSPLKILERGYSITECAGKPVTSWHQVKINDTVEIRLHEGRLQAAVTKTEE